MAFKHSKLEVLLTETFRVLYTIVQGQIKPKSQILRMFPGNIFKVYPLILDKAGFIFSEPGY